MRPSLLAALSDLAKEALILATDSTTRSVLAGVISELDAEHDRLTEETADLHSLHAIYYPLGIAAR